MRTLEELLALRWHEHPANPVIRPPFPSVQGAPFLVPGAGWKRSHVYAVDAREVDGRMVLYFNARDDWHWTRGHEAIGLAVGR